MSPQPPFRIRARIRRWRFLGSLFHLGTLLLAVIALVLSLPKSGAMLLGGESFRQVELRQELMQYLDRLVRYEHYYRELNGRFTRDLTRLGVPDSFANGSSDMRRVFEISVLEISNDRLTLLATGRGAERITIDERHRLNSNFPMPAPSKQVLYSEAQRLLATPENANRMDSIYSGYWNINGSEAIGIRNPVMGERKSLADFSVPEQGNSIFSSISGKLRNPASMASVRSPKQELRTEEVLLILQEMKQAMHIFRRERGFYPSRWEELDQVAGYNFSQRREHWLNLRLNPIDTTERGYKISIDGMLGDLQGEQFILDQSGSVRQIRYTEAIIKQLEESTAMLKSALSFQVSEMGSKRTKPNLDSQKSQPVQLKK